MTKRIVVGIIAALFLAASFACLWCCVILPAQEKRAFIDQYGEKAYDLLCAAEEAPFVTFGAYEQDGDLDNGKEPIEWIVLKKDEMSLLLISRYALDYQSYHYAYTSVTWETGSLRQWLNQDFWQAAFSEEERVMIPTVTVKARESVLFETDAGNDTQDNVFLLDVFEADNWFASDSDRICEATAYALRDCKNLADNGMSWWWLRSPGVYQNIAVGVDENGEAGRSCHIVSDAYAVRPALRVNLAYKADAA